MPSWYELREMGRVQPEEILTDYRVLTPPVPVFEILRDLGIHARFDAAQRAWAHLYARNQIAFVSLLPGEGVSDPQVRWAAAHMLGHVMLHDVPQTRTTGPPKSMTPQEHREAVEADNWTGRFLVPDYLLIPALRSNARVEDIAGWFLTPPQVIRLRWRESHQKHTY